MKDKVKELIDNTISNHHFVKVNGNLYLKKYQIELLEYYHIDYKNCGSITEILFLIQNIMEEEEVEDYEKLDELASSLQEFQYYYNTNK